MDLGGMRSHFTHVIDVAPTVLEIAGIPAPTHVDGIEQEPLHGFSARRLALDSEAPAAARAVLRGRGEPGDVQGRLVALDAPAAHPGCSTSKRSGTSTGVDPDDDPVELYYLPDDFAQAKNLAEQNLDKVEESSGNSSGRRRSATRSCRSSAGPLPSTGSCPDSQGLSSRTAEGSKTSPPG